MNKRFRGGSLKSDRGRQTKKFVQRKPKEKQIRAKKNTNTVQRNIPPKKTAKKTFPNPNRCFSNGRPQKFNTILLAFSACIS
jgi:hypothetical protein